MGDIGRKANKITSKAEYKACTNSILIVLNRGSPKPKDQRHGTKTVHSL